VVKTQEHHGDACWNTVFYRKFNLVLYSCSICNKFDLSFAIYFFTLLQYTPSVYFHWLSITYNFFRLSAAHLSCMLHTILSFSSLCPLSCIIPSCHSSLLTSLRVLFSPSPYFTSPYDFSTCASVTFDLRSFTFVLAFLLLSVNPKSFQFHCFAVSMFNLFFTLFIPLALCDLINAYNPNLLCLTKTWIRPTTVQLLLNFWTVLHQLTPYSVLLIITLAMGLPLAEALDL